MKALLVVDAQNEFCAAGLRAVPNHTAAIDAIQSRIDEARSARMPIAWIRHHNKPQESRAFVPGSWGAELSPGFGPEEGNSSERLFTKDVFGAFTGTGLEDWLRGESVTEVLIVGFYAHMCVSTSAREALMRGFDVSIDGAGTGARALDNDTLGHQTADEVRRSALLQLADMGVTVIDGAGK